MGDKPNMAGTDTRDARSTRYGDAFAAVPSAASDGKAPRTPRGEKTLRKILDAALAEFGSRGFSE
ncbi:MAG TPA: TetR/AcrR family transcriptional regulator, partial [Sphingomicrobium sp.]|nr:TetR/AcrR family transcriptional regulator [Sphingomicrobium sp.]